MGLRSVVPARSIHFSIFNRPPIIVPTIIARAIGGRLCNLLTKNMPILIEISPAINGKVFLKCSGIKRFSEAPASAPTRREPLQTNIPIAIIYFP
jgi:hypothetical protein